MPPTHQEPFGPSKIPQPGGLWDTVVLASVVHQRWPGNAASPTVSHGAQLTHSEKDLGVGLTGCWDAELKAQNSLQSERLSVENEQEAALNRTLPN